MGLFLFPGLRADINNPNLKEYVYLGQYYGQVGEPEKAIRNYEELIRKHNCTPEAAGAWKALGNIYVSLLKQQRGEIGLALAVSEKTGVDSKTRSLRAEEFRLRKKALGSYQTVVDKFPDSAGEALVRMGRVYAFQSPGEEEDGRSIFRRVMNNYPEAAGRAALFLGDSYCRQNEFEKGKNAYHQAVFLFPEVSARAQILISRLDRKLNDFSTAVNDLSPVLNITGIDGLFTEYRCKGSIMREAIELTAENMISEGNPKLAIEHLKNTISTYPGTITALQTQLYLAKIYSEQGKPELAREELNSLISDYPKSIYGIRASLQKAEISSEEEAIKVYETLRTSFPMSKFWVISTRALAGRYLALAEKTEKDKAKKSLRLRSGVVAREIIKKYPCSPKAEQAKAFLKKNKL
jgi:tetratricopeptide (TPR) repeat protein